MSNLNVAIEKSRTQAQKLHETIAETTAKNHAVIRVELQNAADQARHLADSLREVASAQQSDAKQHLQDAASSLDEAAKSGKNIAASSQNDLKTINKAMLFNALAAVQTLSRAVAEKRSSSNLVKR